MLQIAVCALMVEAFSMSKSVSHYRIIEKLAPAQPAQGFLSEVEAVILPGDQEKWQATTYPLLLSIVVPEQNLNFLRR